MSTWHDQLLAWYACNEANASDPFADAHSTARDLTQINSPGVVAGGRTFVAASSQYALGNYAGFNLGTKDFTVALRLSFSSLAAQREIIGKGQTSATGAAMPGWRLAALTSGALRVYFGDATSRITADSSTGVVTTGTSYSLVLRADRAGNLTLRRNNTQVLSASIAAQAGSVNSASLLALGSFSNLGSYGNYLSGTIFAAALWSRLLTDDEATAWHNSGSELAYPAPTSPTRRRVRRWLLRP